MDIETKVVQGLPIHHSSTGSISTPIYQTATFRHPELGRSTGYDYTRTKNPTRDNLESTYAFLESGTVGVSFSTGMAAIAAIFELFSPKDHFIVCDDIYGGSYRFFRESCEKRGLEFTYTNTSLIENIKKCIQPNTKAIYVETPTNPMMKVSDIIEISKLAKEHNLVTIVDNTFLTPYFQRPLELGADIVTSSATKYLGGHNDTLTGLVAVKDSELGERLKFIQNTLGINAAPFDSWLILRGIKTLAVRMERQEKNAITLANWLQEQKLIKKVLYPGLKNHPEHEISKKQSSGFGGMLSFEVASKDLVAKILKNIKIISFAESLGGVESLITYPIVQTHADVPTEMLEKLGVNERLLRLSVGIESPDDLIADLCDAMSC
ncbi:MAG: PLP-dependent transferase [Leptospiraceae bacterium]|nr:PLP-dependent transferase [Leptospiraceae bacterium]MCP5493637.1 PLP-dependent transferase [Leptospiraceae bacterium]